MNKIDEYKMEIRKAARGCIETQTKTGIYTTSTQWFTNITHTVEVRFINQLTDSISKDLSRMKKLNICEETYPLYTKMLEIMSDRLDTIRRLNKES